MEFENEESLFQSLTFDYFIMELFRKKVDDRKRERCLAYLIIRKNQNYTNLAYLLSDQCKVKTKMEIDLFDCKVKKNYKGSILYQLQLSLSYLALASEKDYLENKAIIIKNYVDMDYCLHNTIEIKIGKSENIVKEPVSFYSNKRLGEIFKILKY